MTAVSADFELGVNGASIATTDSGSATAWDSIVKATSATVTYDNTHVARGNLSGKFATNGTGGAGANAIWTTSFGTVTDHYGRFYLWIDTFPSAVVDLVLL